MTTIPTPIALALCALLAIVIILLALAYWHAERECRDLRARVRKLRRDLHCERIANAQRRMLHRTPLAAPLSATINTPYLPVHTRRPVDEPTRVLEPTS
jgi:hypothetical protein